MMQIRSLSLILAAVAAIGLGGCATQPVERQSLAGDYLSGRFAARSNAITKAADAYRDAHLLSPGATDVLREAFLFRLASGDIERAAPLAHKLVAANRRANSNDNVGDRHQSDDIAVLTIAAIAIDAGDYKNAKSAYTAADTKGFMAPAFFLGGIWAEAGLNGPEAALARFKDAPPDMFQGFSAFHQALLLEQAGHMTEARAAHQRSVLGLGGPAGRAAYGAFLERAGAAAAAMEYYGLLLQEPGPARKTAQAGLRRIEKNDASQLYAATTPAQGTALAFYTLGGAVLEEIANQRNAAARAGFRVGDPELNLPLALTQLAIYLDPELIEARRLAATVYNIYGDHKRAFLMLKSIPDTSPYYEQVRIEMAGNLTSLGQTDEAISILKKLIRNEERAVEAQFALSTLLSGADRYEGAVEAVTVVIDNLPTNPDEDAWRFYVSRAASLIELDRWPEAERDLARAVQIAPEQPMALNYLGYSWAERGENLEAAFAMIEKAVALQPRSGAIIDSLGWAHYQRGEFSDAVGHLEHAATLQPEDPTITDHLGDVYWRLERPIEARYQWRHALTLEPSEKLKAALEDKLAHGLSPVEGNTPNEDAEGAGASATMSL